MIAEAARSASSPVWHAHFSWTPTRCSIHSLSTEAYPAFPWISWSRKFSKKARSDSRNELREQLHEARLQQAAVEDVGLVNQRGNCFVSLEIERYDDTQAGKGITLRQLI